MAFPFQSKLFSTPRDPALERCATKPDGHVSIRDNRVGPHVHRIHEALLRIVARDPKLRGRITIAATEINSQTYGDSTRRAVLAYKQDRVIVNSSYQSAADDIVGVMTISRLDDEIAAIERSRPIPPPPPAPKTHQQIIDEAFQRSRRAIAAALSQLRLLESSINSADALDGNAKLVAIQALGRAHARNIAVISARLFVRDPLSQEFRAALRKTIELTEQNARERSTFLDGGTTGRCDRTAPNNGGRVPFAASTKSDPDPRVSVCDPFFASNNADLQRDVLTHEFFHLVGLADVVGTDTTAKALNNANTLAQIVAWITDRTRQVNSDGQEAAVPPLPTP